ncbi:rod shape-determining protein RodA, partial [uncultured Muribaculum sp.]|uniref:rod shape-determining protein RodA n=1 Tax=uncultured Muribaculum sp. TaxID=1918613 RepID=UPI002711DDCA
VGTFIIAIILHFCGVTVNGLVFFISVLAVACIYTLILAFRGPVKKLLITAAAVVTGVVFLFSVNYVFENVLQPHQKQRILVSLGIEEDLKAAGYNVNQSKIAIGSGGLAGKGFLNGTQTKLKYVPEQHTDFIFCTIGEEEGFIGTTAVLLLFLILILRVLSIAERQPTTFGRVYAYCVASYFIFHLAINVGMVIGLCPVIGIPLPFFSYGGSSLWGFTFLLFIMLRIDAARREYMSY